MAIFSLVILAGVMTINTLSFSSKQIPVEAVELPPPPEGATARLAQAALQAVVGRVGNPTNGTRRLQ